MKDKYIIVRSEIGLIAAKIVDFCPVDNKYTLDFNGRLIKIEKEFTYEENGVRFIEAHDIV